MAKEPANKKDKKEKKDNNFFKEFKAELKRVSWPTPKQLVNNTAIVIGIVLLVAVIVFILDVIFENLNNFGVERLKALVTSSSEETTDVETEDIVDGEVEVIDTTEDETATTEETSEVTDEADSGEEVVTEDETTETN